MCFGLLVQKQPCQHLEQETTNHWLVTVSPNYWLRMVTSKSSLFDSDVQVEVKWTPPPHSTTAKWGFTDFLNHFGWFSKGSLHDSRHKLPVLLNCLGKLTSQAASGYDVVVCPPNLVQFPEPYPGARFNVAVGTSLIPAPLKMTRWWFQICFLFTLIHLGKWLNGTKYFFKGGWNHQLDGSSWLMALMQGWTLRKYDQEVQFCLGIFQDVLLLKKHMFSMFMKGINEVR